MTSTQARVWRNWSGLVTTTPERVESPADSRHIVEAVRRAMLTQTTVKMTGAGHSFTAIAAPEHTLLRPDALSGVLSVDPQAMTVTAYAGTRLKDLNLALEHLGLSLHNMGDIAEQTLAGAVSTGTHGTGGTAAGLAAQLAGFEVVTGTGEVLRASESENPEVFSLGRVGLGALGILTSLTFYVEPLFVLEAVEQPMVWEEALGSYDELVAGAHHVDMYWFPHTDRLMVKQNFRTTIAPGDQRPPNAIAAWWEDEALANTVFGGLCRIGNWFPASVPRINRVAAHALSARRYTDLAHRVFVSPRRVRFREMEYAVPREVGLEVLRECRRVIERNPWQISFPVEIRTAPADDVALSTAYGRDSFYLAFHVPAQVNHSAYFSAMESILRAAKGRPHWGKLHTCTAADLAPEYERFAEFLMLRERLDPQRIFANTYVRSVLGH